MNDNKTIDENTPKSKKKFFSWFGNKDKAEPVKEYVEPIIEAKEIVTEVEEPSAINEEPSATKEETSVAHDELSAKTEESLIKAATPTDETRPLPESFFGRLKSGLKRTRGNLSDGLANLFLGQKSIDDDLLEELETNLLMADVGVDATREIIQSLTKKVKRKELSDTQALAVALKNELATLLSKVEQPLEIPKQDAPYVILMVGVNGVGKTTTIGKLTSKLKAEGHSVMLAAGDTFRAAAVEQLQVWGERNNIPVVAQHTGADSASVIYDALESAKAKNVDVLIADTAGRLHTRGNLMEELVKVKRVMGKIDADAPHEVMLILDAGTGQNAINQAVQFNEAVKLTGLTLTKLDGTAKGGVIFSIANNLEIPVRFIGIGEGIDDLRPFNSKEFIDALFADE
ncbi:MAG: signal recognition particle-docking protein FtsY [Gammaproteobacteria bacterium]|nr:signal recognition particle-docking protein FtsY [Gammaproteobacteria bacterium]